MKNVILIINALLVLAVGYLFYKQFSGKETITSSNTEKRANAGDEKKLTIAYIDLDSVQVNYELAKAVQKEIKAKEASTTAELDRMEKMYRNKLSGYQQKAKSMTEAEAANARQDMENTQNQMMERRQALTEEYNQFVASKQIVVKKTIEDFLKTFNADRTYSFIFSYEPGLFYYKDTTYDITRQVLKGLNTEYKNKK